MLALEFGRFANPDGTDDYDDVTFKLKRGFDERSTCNVGRMCVVDAKGPEALGDSCLPCRLEALEFAWRVPAPRAAGRFALRFAWSVARSIVAARGSGHRRMQRTALARSSALVVLAGLQRAWRRLTSSMASRALGVSRATACTSSAARVEWRSGLVAPMPFGNA